MQGQLKLWPTDENRPSGPPLWERLTREQQATLLTALAQLIAQTVWPENHPPELPNHQGNNHEH